MSTHPQISFVMATYNRRDVVLNTLQQLGGIASEACGSEIIVVDNASLDGTPQVIRAEFPDATVIELTRNLGSCAKAIGVERAAGDYVVFLDDDSYPQPGSIARMLEKFAADPKLGCANFMAHLPDGRCECSALPNVYIGCGVGFRREALLEAGNLDREFFMQAEEYDLSFRLTQAGWKVRTFADLHVDHLKSPQARIGGRTLYYDTRNNLIVAARYLNDLFEKICTDDWLQRYRWLTAGFGQRWAFQKGCFAGKKRRDSERATYAPWRLSAAAFEEQFHYDYIAGRMKTLADSGAQRIILADLGKNIYPFVRAARQLKLDVLCIADDRFALPHSFYNNDSRSNWLRNPRRYRDIPIVPTAAAPWSDADAVVVSNTSPIHAENRAAALLATTDRPVYLWFGQDFHAGQDDPTWRSFCVPRHLHAMAC